MNNGSFYFDPEAPGVAVFLGPTEAALMELAWRHRSLTVKKALLYLAGEQSPAYTTVMTVLSRLAEKGLLHRTKQGRTYEYRPAMNREEFVTERVQRVLTCLRKNFPQQL